MADQIRSLLKRLKNEQSAATMVEYGLMLALIALVCFAAIVVVGTESNGLFTANGNALSNSL